MFFDAVLIVIMIINPTSFNAYFVADLSSSLLVYALARFSYSYLKHVCIDNRTVSMFYVTFP